MIRGLGGSEHFKLARRIGPLIAFSGREQDGTRRAKRDEAVLIKWELFRMLVKRLKVFIEPMREAVVNSFDRLSIGAAARCAPTATGLMWESNGYPLVVGRGQ